MSRARPIILDCDPGIDDAMALYFALAHPAIALGGITTTFGNVTVAQATRNALYLCALAGRRLPVCEGAPTPLQQRPVPANPAVHGADGLGNLPGRLTHSDTPDARPAARFIVEMARAKPGELTLVAVGPLGNLYQALQLEPGLPKLLREVILMGGSIAEPGNVSPVAEANIWHDPHAADAVFTAGFQLTMVGLDVTHRVLMPLALFERIATRQQHPATDTLLQAVRHYAGFYGALYPALARTRSCFGHDVLAPMYLVHPELFSTESGRVRVVTKGLAQGQTIMNRRPALAYVQAGWGAEIPASTACLQVDAAACLDVFEHTLLQNWLQTPA